MRVNSAKLAIIIPFYKSGHFQELLAALAAQTDKRFSVYIGDDCSTDSVHELIAKYAELLPLCYVRFATRMGHISLTKQWDRCVALVQGEEEWVWVLPDDDLPSNNCVHEFYQVVGGAEKNNVNAFRFPIDIIDTTGSILSKNKEINPGIEAGHRYFARAMKGDISTSLGDIIFNRKALLSTGGFVDFPQAWGSDQATVLRATYNSNIQVLSQGRLGFRMSGMNISSQRDDGLQKVRARIEFAHWLKHNQYLLTGEDLSLIYRNFARKHDCYLVDNWEFSWAVWWHLYRLRLICTGNYNPLPLIKLLLLRVLNKRG